MKKRFKNLIILCGAFFTFAPLFIFAQESSFVLKEKQSLDILNIIRQYPLSEAQFELFYDSIASDSDSSIKAGAVMFTKQAILQNELDYWLVKMSAEFSKRFIKAVYKIAPAIVVGDFSGVIDLIEKYTVEQANAYIDKWMKQNQVQIGSGIGKYAFVSFKNNPQVINIPYIIVYSPIDTTKAKIVVEFYSQKAIEPPESRGGAGALGGNQESLKSTVWPWDRWITSKYNKNDKIEPFIVRVKGRVVKDKYGNFTWDKSVEAPVVEVEFGKPVPEIDQSDIILADLKANQSQGFLKDKINQIKEKAQGIVDQINQFFKIFKTPSQAEISSFVPKKSVDSSAPEKDLKNLVEQSQTIINQAEQIITKDNATSVQEVVEKMQEQAKEKIEEIALASPVVVATSSVITTTTQLVICNQATNQEPSFDKIIFNEIAWMGTTKSASDEWIELKNISSLPVDLNGWQIFNKKQGIKIFFTTTTIVSPGGFLLLERTDDNTVPKIKADYIYTGALANTDEMLYLVGLKCILQDKVKATPYWVEGDNSTKETMERNQFYGWQTSSVVGGTPRAKNSIGKDKPTGGGGGTSANSQSSIINFQNTTSTATTTQETTTTTEQATTTQATSTIAATSSKEVLIVEIQVEGASTSDDFIKIFNQSTSSVADIAGWKFRKRSSTGNETSIKVIGSGAVILPQSYFIWLNSHYATTIDSGIGVATSTATIAKNNSVALLDKNDEIIDQVAWGSSTNPFVEGQPFSQNPSEGKNLIRIQNTGDNSVDFILTSTSQATTTQTEEPLELSSALPAIVNLMAVLSTVRGSVDLFWTCPTSATAYIIKKSEQEISISSWDTAETISQNIVPKPAGEVEILNIENLLSDTKFYFAVKYVGLNGQESLVSDNVSVRSWSGFVDNADTTITDLRTNLTWQKDANSPINNFGTSSLQYNAIDFVAQQNSDWRLPNFKELASLIEYKPNAPSAWKGFENIKPEKYWTSLRADIASWGPGVPHTYGGWYVNFTDGQMGKDYYDGIQSQYYPFMTVKGSENNDPNFTDNTDGTIKDNRTGLLWLNQSFAQTGNNIKTWNSAFLFASNVVLCNDGTLQGTASIVGDCSNNGGVKYDDFRLPNVQEIIEITTSGESEILSGEKVYYYWSSTMFNDNNFWMVGNGSILWGSVIYQSKTSENSVQLVREP